MQKPVVLLVLRDPDALVQAVALADEGEIAALSTFKPGIQTEAVAEDGVQAAGNETTKQFLLP